MKNYSPTNLEQSTCRLLAFGYKLLGPHKPTAPVNEVV